MPRPPKELFKQKVGAFFDVDYVIVKKDFYRLLAEHLKDEGKISIFKFLQGYIWYIKFKLNILDGEAVLKKQVEKLRGMPVEKFKKMAQEIFERAKEYIYKTSINTIKEHKKAGHIVCLLSGNFKLLIEPLARFLQIDWYIGVELEEENGVLTGKVKEPMPIGEGKKYWLLQFAREHNIDLSQSYFYTDSIWDLPALEIVGHPIAVNPDRKLRSIARKRNWTILSWQE